MEPETKHPRGRNHLVLLVRKYIRTYGRPDLIHAHFGTWAGYAARLVYKWYRIPYVITEHASSINGNQTTPSQAVILKKAYSEARKIICVGTKLKRSLCAYVSDPDTELCRYEHLCIQPSPDGERETFHFHQHRKPE